MGCSSSNSIEIIQNDLNIDTISNTISNQIDTSITKSTHITTKSNIADTNTNTNETEIDIVISDNIQSIDWWKKYISSNEKYINYHVFINIFHKHFIENKYYISITHLNLYFDIVLDRHLDNEINKNMLLFSSFDRFASRYGSLEYFILHY